MWLSGMAGLQKLNGVAEQGGRQSAMVSDVEGPGSLSGVAERGGGPLEAERALSGQQEGVQRVVHVEHDLGVVVAVGAMQCVAFHVPVAHRLRDLLVAARAQVCVRMHARVRGGGRVCVRA
eukprot:355676-Chlamydomonas_euryale.AAC.1